MRKSLNIGRRYHHLMGTLTRALVLRPGVVDAIIGRAKRTPYEHIDGYMERYWLVRPSRWTLGLGLRVHGILRSDHDRAMHSHPWWNVSLLLRGTYWEVMPARHDDPGAHYGGYVNLDEPFRMEQRHPGDLVFRPRLSRHKLMLFRGTVWTLFVTGPETRDASKWGYYVPGEGWVDRNAYRVKDEE